MKLHEKVTKAVTGAQAIAFDGCHKIYILMDVDQVRLMRQYGYGDGTDDSKLIEVTDVEDAVDTVLEWFEESCSLRFIEAVSTNEDDPHAGFESIVSQFEEVARD